MPTLRELGEIETLARLAKARGNTVAGQGTSAPPPDVRSLKSGVILGSGDDAAVVRASPECDLVATADGFVEGRHYAPQLFTAREIGARLAAANLSDMAAMAATPRWALLSLGVRADHEVDALVGLQEGALSALEPEGACIVGGNITAVTGEEWASLTLLGEVRRGRSWTRSGAKPGDLIAVTGNPGRAAAGYLLWQKLGTAAQVMSWRPVLDAWVRPVPRIAFALALAETSAVSAAIDLSDGFGGNLAQVCKASTVGAEIEEARWGPDGMILRAAETLGVDATTLRYGPSDDYELLMAVDPMRRVDCERVARDMGVPFAIAGRFTDVAGSLVRVLGGAKREPLEVSGFDHFEGNA